MDLHVAGHLQLVGGGVVGGARGAAVAILEDKGRGTVGSGAVRLAVEVDAGRLDGDGGARGRAFFGHTQRDFDFAFREEVVVG